MALNHSPSIVTNGLFLYLDAANRRSYPGSGNTWFDISGRNNNGTLTNGPIFTPSNGGSILCDGVNDYIISNISKSLFSSNITISIFFRLRTNSTLSGLLQFADNLNDGMPWILLHRDSNTSVVWYVNNGYRMYHTVLTNIIYSLDLTYDGVTWRSYLNGNLQASYSSGTGAWSGNFFWLGNAYSGYSNLEIYNVKVYNRPLLFQEITQNYNATKGRFGL